MTFAQLLFEAFVATEDTPMVGTPAWHELSPVTRARWERFARYLAELEVDQITTLAAEARQ
jgi:hypothetical protein